MILEFTEVHNMLVCATPDVSREADPILYVKCYFHLNSRKWINAAAITAMFKSASYGKTDEIMLDSSNSCYMPVEVYEHGGVVQVILDGTYYEVDGRLRDTGYLGPASVFFGRNPILPIPLPSKYDVFVAEFTNIKRGLDESTATLEELIERYNTITDAYVNDEYHLVIEFSNEETYVSVQSLKGDKGDKGDPRDYSELPDKPSIEGVVLQDDKSFEDLGLKHITTQQIIDIVNM